MARIIETFKAQKEGEVSLTIFWWKKENGVRLFSIGKSNRARDKLNS